MTVLLLAFTCGNEAAVTCPNSASLAPCTCSDSGDGTTAILDCYSLSLSDAQVSQILSAYISSTRSSPLSYLLLTDNLLTKVLDQIGQLAQLDKVELNFNSITTVASGAFNFRTTLKDVYLNNNKLTSIAAGAFQGINFLSIFTLDTNLMYRFISRQWIWWKGFENSLTN